jgi:hypothetical protein
VNAADYLRSRNPGDSRLAGDYNQAKNAQRKAENDLREAEQLVINLNALFDRTVLQAATEMSFQPLGGWK